MREIFRTFALLALGVSVIYILTTRLASQPAHLPEPFQTVQAENPQSTPSKHDVKDEALKKFGFWQQQRRDHNANEVQAFRDFKNYWEGFLTSDDQKEAIRRLYKLPEGVIPSAGSPAVSFKSKDIYSQFQEFLDQSYR